MQFVFYLTNKSCSLCGLVCFFHSVVDIHDVGRLEKKKKKTTVNPAKKMQTKKKMQKHQTSGPWKTYFSGFKTFPVLIQNPSLDGPPSPIWSNVHENFGSLAYISQTETPLLEMANQVFPISTFGPLV